MHCSTQFDVLGVFTAWLLSIYLHGLSHISNLNCLVNYARKYCSHTNEKQMTCISVTKYYECNCSFNVYVNHNSALYFHFLRVFSAFKLRRYFATCMVHEL